MSFVNLFGFDIIVHPLLPSTKMKTILKRDYMRGDYYLDTIRVVSDDILMIPSTRTMFVNPKTMAIIRNLGSNPMNKRDGDAT